VSVRAAVFDLDGTLIHTEPRNRLVWSRLFEINGVPYDETHISAFTGRRGHEVLAEFLHLFPGRTVEDLFAEAVAFERHPEFPAAEPVPGAVELVTGLHRDGVPIGLVTSGSRKYASGLLDQLGVTGLFDVVVTADDVTVGKPDPEGFLTAARALGVAPSDTAAFEDAPAGVAAAKSAGYAVVVGVATTQAPDVLAAADLVVTDLTEVNWPLHVNCGLDSGSDSA
jgi:sugar-phosphatase